MKDKIEYSRKDIDAMLERAIIHGDRGTANTLLANPDYAPNYLHVGLCTQTVYRNSMLLEDSRAPEDLRTNYRLTNERVLETIAERWPAEKAAALFDNMLAGIEKDIIFKERELSHKAPLRTTRRGRPPKSQLPSLHKETEPVILTELKNFKAILIRTSRIRTPVPGRPLDAQSNIPAPEVLQPMA